MVKKIKKQAMKKVYKIITVNDKMQDGYRYELTESTGKNFDPAFKPDLTPKEMLALGVFGGKYLTDCQKEFPVDWFSHAKLNSDFHDPRLNFFRVNASQSLAVWKKKGWIWADDPRGWFQWYCRYYLGRRCADDARQIKRWKAINRHIAQIKKNCPSTRLGKSRKPDLTCRVRQRQAVLHWAYDARKI